MSVLVCQGGTYPAQLMYQELADMACNRITAGITAAFIGEHPIKAVLDSYKPVGSTAHVRFNTSRASLRAEDRERVRRDDRAGRRGAASTFGVTEDAGPADRRIGHPRRGAGPAGAAARDVTG